MPYNFINKRIAVIGMARSGLAAAEVLTKRGAKVVLIDSKPEAELSEALEFARERKIEARGGASDIGNAELVVTSPGVPKSAEVLKEALAKGVPIWGEIEAAYRISPASILAITGTNGKTTTTAMLGAIAQQAGYKTFVGGNIAAGSLALPLIRAADQAKGEDVIVAEISSFQLEWIDAFRPKVAAILNITADHSDRQTWDEYLASKWRIFENQTAAETAVLRSDVPKLPRTPELQSDIVYFDLETRPGWLSEIKLPGEHNRENVMAARAMALAFGIEEDAIRTACTKFAGVVHRLEYVATIDGAIWFNNSMCTNNDAFVRSLAAMEGPKVVIAGGVYKGGDTDQLARAMAEPSVRALILFGKCGPMLAETAGAAGARRVETVETLREAASLAKSLAVSGDTVLLSPACASFDQFKNFEDRGDQFKAMVRGMAG